MRALVVPLGRSLGTNGRIPVRFQHREMEGITMPQVGIMHSGSASTNAKQIEALIGHLEVSGYAHGRNGVSVPPATFAEDDREKLEHHAQDWIQKHQVDVLVAAGGSASSEAARKATEGLKNPPAIVFTSVANPVRPAPHMTGVCARTSELDSFRLNLLRELIPTDHKFGALTNPSRPKYSEQWRTLEAAAQILDVRLDREELPAASPDQIDRAIDAALDRLKTRGNAAVLVTADPVFNNHREKVVEAARRNKIPAIYQWREFADVGGLMSYGPDLTEAYKLAAIYVARILDGTAPSSLPIVQVTDFDLIINLRTASVIRIVVPETLLARADVLIR